MFKTKTNIALAYLSLVEKDSILNVSNDAIIQESEVSRGTFYNNFSNQQDILDYIQAHIEKEVIIPIKDQLSTFPNKDVNVDRITSVVAEILIPVMYRQIDILSKLYRCQLNRLWVVPLFKVFNRFISPSMDQTIKNDNKTAISYILLILESWVSNPTSIPPAEFRVKFCRLIQQPAIELLLKE
ncbi:TetR/AcrR family transcriptional regulator [Lactobacillaceae bacterium Melli_B4]